MKYRWLTAIAVLALLMAACGGGDDASSGQAGSGAETGEPEVGSAEPVQGVTDDEIFIAGFGPLTGSASWVGLGNRDGFSLAVKEINEAGGIHGRQIRFEFEDDAFEVSQAQQVVRRLIDQQQPFMIYAGTGSTVFLSVADALRDAGIPTYNGFSGSEAARATPEVETMFHGEAVSTQWVVPTTVDLLVDDLQAERVALMHEDGEWGKTLCDGIQQELESAGNVELVTVQTYGAADTDFSGQLVAIRDADPQVVVNCGLFPAAKIILRQANELGVDALFVGDAGQANPTVWADGGAATENWVFNWYEPYFMTDETGPMGEFRERYLAEYPDAPEGRPNHADTFSYGAAYLLAEALERAGPELTQEGFLQALSSISGFQATPISPEANCDNERNECFVETVWMLVQDGRPTPADEEDMAELSQLVASG